MSINRCIFDGRLGKDPEIGTTQSGKNFARFSLAVNAGKDQPPHWFNFTAWEKTADTIGQYCRKGDQIIVEARAELKAYRDRNGNERRDIQFSVTNFSFGSKGRAGEGQPEREPSPGAGPEARRPEPRPQPAARPPARRTPEGEPGVFDDIPDDFIAPQEGDPEVPF
mgnify:CR=1 FL=1